VGYYFKPRQSSNGQKRKKNKMTTNTIATKTGQEVPATKWNAVETKAIELGREAYEAGKHFADRFREFSLFARKNLEPKRITAVLIECGFTPKRASDIKALCMAPDETFKAYQNKEIGWKPTIEASRQERATKSGRARKSTFSNSTAQLLTILNKMKCEDVNYLEGLSLGLVVFPLKVCEKTFKSANGFTTHVSVNKE